jgi:Tol biopolymer transport system component
VIPCLALNTKNRETLPCWSPDGKWLYFVCAPPRAADEDNSRTRYSLCRISFDAGTGSWGIADTIIAASDINRSISFPRVSPDGKYLLFCMTSFGYFTIFDQQSDLYFYEIATGHYWPLACNSPSMESSHSWSRNSRWFVFASKRMDNMYTRPFFAYVDSGGKVHKPFVMPQQDPAKYQTYLLNYNLPELVDGMVEIREQKIRDIVMKDPIPADFQMPETTDAISGETMVKKKE